MNTDPEVQRMRNALADIERIRNQANAMRNIILQMRPSSRSDGTKVSLSPGGRIAAWWHRRYEETPTLTREYTLTDQEQEILSEWLGQRHTELVDRADQMERDLARKGESK
jgi:hypothetical protein